MVTATLTMFSLGNAYNSKSNLIYFLVVFLFYQIKKHTMSQFTFKTICILSKPNRLYTLIHFSVTINEKIGKYIAEM